MNLLLLIISDISKRGGCVNWKVVRNAISDKGSFSDESKFILGLDIGSCTSVLAYWDVNRNEPALIDMSGGYGKPQMPTVLQYIPETSEWIFGEYAILNKGYFNDVTVSKFPDKLGFNEYIDIDGKSMSVAQLLSRYIKELLDMCKNINPNADICGLVIATPTYMSHEAKDELRRACLLSGYEKEFICFVDERECVLRYKAFFEKTLKDERVLIVDYGACKVRGGVFDVSLANNNVYINALSSVVNFNISGNSIDNKIESLMRDFFYTEKKINAEQISMQDKIQLDSFVYQNKFLLFQQGNKDKNIKLYYNFAYPPFQKVINSDTKNKIIKNIKLEFSVFIDDLFNKTLELAIDYNDITSIICSGGGFDMYWVKEELEKKFTNANFLLSKTPKGIVAQGACIAAASYIGVIENKNYILNDKHRLFDDYGIMVSVNNKEKFIPIIERNSFWWETNRNQKFILDDSTEKQIVLELFKRNEQGFEHKIAEFNIEGLPLRPKGTTKLSLLLEFERFNKLTTTVTDCGFGELFPTCGFKRSFTVKL